MTFAVRGDHFESLVIIVSADFTRWHWHLQGKGIVVELGSGCRKSVKELLFPDQDFAPTIHSVSHPIVIAPRKRYDCLRAMKTSSQRPVLSVLASSPSPRKSQRGLRSLFERLLSVEPQPSSDFGRVIHASFQPYRRIIE
jgi:hypothetical protein